MTEYIKREELMEFPIRRNHYDRKNGNKHFINGIETVLEYAENLPAADVAPVRHGQWIIGVNNDDFDVKCEWTDIFEVAGIATVERIAKAMHYCPNCGAKMDGGAD
jgi:hypothetical protein